MNLGDTFIEKLGGGEVWMRAQREERRGEEKIKEMEERRGKNTGERVTGADRGEESRGEEKREKMRGGRKGMKRRGENKKDG